MSAVDPSPSPLSVVRWDFFLSHAGADDGVTETLYDSLLRLGVKPYFDQRCLRLGDPWSSVLPAMLKASAIVVVLVSPKTRCASYQDSEIRLAIDLVRDFPERYRVIAVLLDAEAPIRRTELPFGLERTALLSWRECVDAEGVARRLVQTLRQVSNVLGAQHKRPMIADATAAFIGEMAWGPLHPVLMTQWSDYAAFFSRPFEVERSFTAIALRAFFENGGTRAYAVRVASKTATVAHTMVKTMEVAQYLVVSARYVGSLGNNIRVGIQPASRRGVRLTVSLDGESSDTEDYDNLSWSEGGPNPMLQRVNGRSKWLALQWSLENATGAEPVAGEWTLAGGSDGISRMDDFAGRPTGEAGPATGIEALAELDEAGLLCLPDAVHPRFGEEERAALTQRIVSIAERSHRLALLSTAQASFDGAYAVAPSESSYACAVVPWVQVADSADTRADGPSGTRTVAVPAVGHLAGLLARHDAVHGLHRSPRGELITGVVPPGLGLEVPVFWTADACARRGVNLLATTDAPADGLQLCSAVTCAVDDDWTRLEVRRTLNFIYRRLAAATAWITFAPNNEMTWAQFRSDVEEFLTDLWKAGLLLGDTPEESFFVRCGRDTMTDADIAEGRINYVCGLALPPGTPSPSLPALMARPAVALRTT